MLSRAIMAPRDLLLDTAEAQRMALFFDHILIWPLDRIDLQKEESARINAELEYLRESGVVLKCGFHMPPIISFQSADGQSWSPFDMASENCDIVLPFQLVTGVPKESENEAHADRIVRHISSQLVYNEAPVLAHLKPVHLAQSGLPNNTVELVLKNVPLPPENMPWEDFVQFRKEEENIAKLRSLRIWLQKQASSKESASAMQEELEALLYEYQKYMEIQHKKYSEGIVSTLIASSCEIIGHLLALNPGSALKALFDVRAHSVALTEAEMSAPGREVSYIASARKLVKSHG